jgi:hypothetical protein
MFVGTKAAAAFMIWMVAAAAAPTAHAVLIGGTIDSDTTWTGAEKIIVTSDVFISATGHVHVEAGAAVYFLAGTGLIVEGELTTGGTGSDRVLFTSSADTALGSPSAGGWTGISFQNTGTGVLQGSDVRYANNCLVITVTSPVLRNCTIANFLSSGVNINAAGAIVPITPLIDSCVIGQSLYTLRGTSKGMYAYGRVDLTVSNSVVHDCLIGLEFYSTTSNVPQFELIDCTIRDNSARGIYTHPG